MDNSHFQRVIEELCEQVGFKNADLLVKGGKLRINEYLVSFIYDEAYNPNQLFIYVDMGLPERDREDALKTLLKINFGLAAGERGVLSMHPQTNHLFYSFGYVLNESATGRDLLDSLIRFVGEVVVDALELPKDVQQAKEVSALASRKRAARVFQTAATAPDPE